MKMKLGYKILINILFIIAMLSLASIFAISYSLEKLQQDRLKTAEVLFAKSLSEKLFREVIEGRVSAITSVLFEEKKLRDEKIEYILVFNEKGYLLSHTYLGTMPREILGLHENFGEGGKYRIKKIAGKGFFVYDIAVPVMEGIKEVGTLHVGIKGGYIENLIEAAATSSLIVIAIVTVIAVFLSLLMSAAIVRPVTKLNSALIKVSRGDLDTNIEVESNDEIGELGASFNKMTKDLRDSYADLRNTHEMLAQAEKMTAVGQLASGVAHEVRNPLGIILQGLNYLEGRLPNGQQDLSETLAMLKESVSRADKIIDGMLNFSRFTKLDLRPEQVNSILDSSLTLVKDQFKTENIEIVRELKDDLPSVLVDKNKLEQVFINVLLNAVQAIPDGGKVVVRSYDKRLTQEKDSVGRRITNHFHAGEQVVIIEFEDTGIGIPEENIKKIFDPFFTTKGPKSGTGLGLSVSRNILQMHKGLIYAESRYGQGTKITVILKTAGRGISG